MKLLSKKDTISMRGVAIMFIVIHNLLHLMYPIKENEFTFQLNYSHGFITHLCNMNLDLWKDVFSFLGWYGVTIFLFISGYGLVCKYEYGNECISFKIFFKKHYSKLFYLMLIPYLLYILSQYLLSGTVKSPIAIIAQLSMLSNLYPPFIDPGIYWFFGLMVELYTFYYFFIYKKKNSHIIYFNIISILLMFISFHIPNDTFTFLSSFTLQHSAILSLLRKNFIGWILPFTFGIIYARLKLTVTFESQWINFLSLFISILLLILSNLNIYTWTFSPIFSILAAIYFCSISKTLPFVYNRFINLGQISAFLFATHPIIRYIYIHFIKSSEFIPICLYFTICIIVALFYKIIHKKLFILYDGNQRI